jgi:hypothetical protein
MIWRAWLSSGFRFVIESLSRRGQRAAFDVGQCCFTCNLPRESVDDDDDDGDDDNEISVAFRGQFHGLKMMGFRMRSERNDCVDHDTSWGKKMMPPCKLDICLSSASYEYPLEDNSIWNFALEAKERARQFFRTSRILILVWFVLIAIPSSSKKSPDF